MEALLSIGLSNALMATALAGLAFVASRICRNQPFVYCLWLIVLVKLVTPPLVFWPWHPSGLTELLETRKETAEEEPAASLVEPSHPFFVGRNEYIGRRPPENLRREAGCRVEAEADGRPARRAPSSCYGGQYVLEARCSQHHQSFRWLPACASSNEQLASTYPGRLPMDDSPCVGPLK